MVVTDMNGGEWHYPESRATSMSVMVHARRSTQLTPPMVHERGGARTVSTTVPCEEREGQETEDNENQIVEHYVQVNRAEIVEGGGIEEHECNEEGDVLDDGDKNEPYEMEHEEHQRQGWMESLQGQDLLLEPLFHSSQLPWFMEASSTCQMSRP